MIATAPEVGAGLGAFLRRAGLGAELQVRGRLLRVTGGGSAAYVEERPGAPANARWVVHLDGRGREASRQHVCASPGEVLAVLRSSLA